MSERQINEIRGRGRGRRRSTITLSKSKRETIKKNNTLPSNQTNLNMYFSASNVDDIRKLEDESKENLNYRAQTQIQKKQNSGSGSRTSITTPIEIPPQQIDETQGDVDTAQGNTSIHITTPPPRNDNDNDNDQKDENDFIDFYSRYAPSTRSRSSAVELPRPPHQAAQGLY